MQSNQIFLAAFDKGIARAEQGPTGNWSVSNLHPELTVTCLAADPSNSKVVYAGTREKGVWRSLDGGLTWEPRGMQGQVVKSLAVSAARFRRPSTSGANPHGFTNLKTRGQPGWSSSLSGGSRTAGGGSRRRNRPIAARMSLPSLPHLPTRRSYWPGWSLGRSCGVRMAGRPGPDIAGARLRDCHSLKFHASNGDWAYEAGGSGGGASFSRDGGVSWQKAKRGLAKNYGIVCAADPEKPEIWYVCVAPSPFNAFGKDPRIHLYRSTGGAGWEPIGWESHPLPEAPTALVTVPGSPGNLYAGLYRGNVWHTANYGDSWEKLPFNLGGIWFSMLVI